ncbi:MAG: branched-chain amino acid ABC transporter permease [Candidatus Rokubacteria bacterium]|nr:branched-chain amino acid ABC transporter permease [Candidatus Rokubacteria bacterium]
MGLFLQLFTDGVVIGCVYALVALGFVVILSTTGIWHFAHAAVYSAAAYWVYFATVERGMPLVLAALLSLPFAACLGLLIDVVAYRPLRRRNAAPTTVMIVSIAVMTFLENGIAILFGTDNKSLGTVFVAHGYSVGPVVITTWSIITLVATAVLFVTLILFQQRTEMGAAMRAVGNNADMARVVGINVGRIYLVAFALGSALVAPAAVLVSIHSGISPTMGLEVLLTAVAAVIVGGVGSIPGVLLGGLLIGVAGGVGVWQIPSQWQQAIAFAILFLFIIFRPTGFFGGKVKSAAV